jgi:ribosome biogenesis GTPase
MARGGLAGSRRVPGARATRGGYGASLPDEDDASFARPSKHGSRRRTKQRPDHLDATSGFVTSVDRGRYAVLLDEGAPAQRTVAAMKARDLAEGRVVVGDRVDVVGDTSGAAGTLARIVRIAQRTSVLRRTADDTDPYERLQHTITEYDITLP